MGQPSDRAARIGRRQENNFVIRSLDNQATLDVPLAHYCVVERSNGIRYWSWTFIFCF
jgi:hypothetical protein